jgi:hypothetical protein
MQLGTEASKPRDVRGEIRDDDEAIALMDHLDFGRDKAGVTFG